MQDYKILTSDAEIEAIAHEWSDLHDRFGRSPVTDVDRFRSWWNTIGKGQASRSLHVVIGRENRKLTGVLPLSVERRKGARMLQSDGGMAFECCDVLAETPAQAAGLWQAARASKLYDFAHIKNIYPQSIGFEGLAAFAHPRDAIDSFFLRFDWPNSAAWMASLSGNRRGNFRRCARRLEEKGPLTYSVYEGGPVPKEVVDGLVKQKLAWANRRDKHGLFDHAGVAGYFDKLAETMAARGALFLAWLKCGENIIAYNLGFIHQGILRMYFWTYDPSWAALSPGNVIMVNSISWALDHGLKGIDFMHTTDSDSEKHFKQKYANEKQICTEFTFSRSLFGYAMENLFVLRRAISRMKRRKQAATPAQNETE